MQKTKKTKIIATLGPSSSNAKIIKAFIDNEVDIFRLNFSHGTHADHSETINIIRSVKEDMPIMADLKGAEIRTIVKNKNGIKLKEGKDVELLFNPDEIDDNNFSVNYNKIFQISKKNNHIMADDGNIDLAIDAIKNDRLVLKSQKDGILKDRKGTHFIGVDVPFPILTQSDKIDIEYAITQNVDFIAASMIKSEKEIYAIKGLLPENIKLVAKIEHPEAIKNLEKILEASDVILVARGDLGVEMPITEVPIAQKNIVAVANKSGKPVIIATQLLDSMMHNPRPTRAEVSDIANAIYDKTDALLLTGETAAGKYPVEAIQFLCETAFKTEQNINYKKYKDMAYVDKGNSSEAISYAALDVAYSLKAKAIICFSSTGSTALRAAKFRPEIPIITFTPDENAAKYLKIVFGIIPYKTTFFSDPEELIEKTREILKNEGFAQTGDIFIITAGVPLGIAGNTNMLKIIEIE